MENGPVHLFLDVTENLIIEPNHKSNFSFVYYSNISDRWIRTTAKDDSDSFTKKGDIKFFFQPDFSNYMVFGKNIYWIKCINDNDVFFSSSQSSPDDILKAKETIKSDSKNVSPNNKMISLPEINALYLNTEFAINAARREREVLGSSNGQPNQFFVT